LLILIQLAHLGLLLWIYIGFTLLNG